MLDNETEKVPFIIDTVFVRSTTFKVSISIVIKPLYVGPKGPYHNMQFHALGLIYGVNADVFPKSKNVFQSNGVGCEEFTSRSLCGMICLPGR